MLEKLSSYNLFTNLFPGVVFCFFADKYLSYPLIQEDFVVGIFLYYFVGLVISRIGSVVIEPLLIWAGILKYASYGDYVAASKKDSKIDLLLETNNMYRSATSLFACMALLLFFDLLKTSFVLVEQYYVPILVALFLALFVLSYRKQTNYIRKRIEANGSSENK